MSEMPTQLRRSRRSCASGTAVCGCAIAAGFVLAMRAAAAPAPVAPPVVPPAALDGAIAHGLAFLLARQHADGSWGSPRNTKGLNIYAPVPSAHDTFRAACTALALEALARSPASDGAPESQAARNRARAWLLAHLPDIKRCAPDALYNVWAHAYGIQALVYEWQRLPPGRERTRTATVIRGQIERLAHYADVSGGWSYYDHNVQALRPAGPAQSVVTATALLALHAAAQAGFEVPRPTIIQAVEALERQRKPDSSYLYGEQHWWRPMHTVNRNAGGLGRNVACNLALRAWSEPDVPLAVLREQLDRLLDRNGWLDIGRKRPVPHEAWFQVAGYYFYYGHYHAARAATLLPPAERAPILAGLKAVLVPLQERDGSWWDYPFYDYHQDYGTALALLSLALCRETH